MMLLALDILMDFQPAANP